MEYSWYKKNEAIVRISYKNDKKTGASFANREPYTSHFTCMWYECNE